MSFFLVIRLLTSLYAEDPYQPLVPIERIEEMLRKEQWSEAMFQAKFVPSAEQTKAWEALVEKTAFLLFSQKSVTAPGDIDGIVSVVIRDYPHLRKSKAFMEKAESLAFKAFQECFDSPISEQDCAERALKWVTRTSAQFDFVRKVAVLSSERTSPEETIPFLAYVLETSKHTEACLDPFWQKVLLAGLEKKDAVAPTLLKGKCLTELKDKIPKRSTKKPE